MSAFILEKLCRGCKRCVNACPVQAITMPAHLPIVDPKMCIECENCMEACMHGAITFTAPEERNRMDKNEEETERKVQHNDQQDLLIRLNKVEKELADVKARWPYHSVQPKMVAEREDLEEERERLLSLLNPKQKIKHGRPKNKRWADMIIIRQFNKTDTEELVEIWYNASIIAHSFIPKEMWESHKEELRNKYLPQAETWVAEENGKLYGFISLLEDLIGGLFVAPAKQGVGIGTILIEQAKKVKRQLFVGVYSKNSSARKFYIKHGFTYINQEVQPETREIVINMGLEIG